MSTSKQAPPGRPLSSPPTMLGEMTAASKRGFETLTAYSGKVPSLVLPGGRKRVLLVQGEWEARMIFQHKLRRAGLDVEVALNGCLALQKLHSTRPDAILTDLIIGGIEATELITEARNDPKFSKRPIYLFTCKALHDESSGREAKAGATKIFNKLS